MVNIPWFFGVLTKLMQDFAPSTVPTFPKNLLKKCDIWDTGDLPWPTWDLGPFLSETSHCGWWNMKGSTPLVWGTNILIHRFCWAGGGSTPPGTRQSQIELLSRLYNETLNAFHFFWCGKDVASTHPISAKTTFKATKKKQRGLFDNLVLKEKLTWMAIYPILKPSYFHH